MSQTKLESFLEALTNTLISYVIGVGTSLTVLPMYGVHLSLQDNMGITAWFTVVSLIRGYIIRRWFNAKAKESVIMPD